MTAELVAFLRARLDEQEAAAVAAGGAGEGWQALGTGVYSAASVDDDVPPLVTAGPEVGGSDEDAARAEHIALHDPAQVLREVAATRGLLKRYTTPETGEGLPDAFGHHTAGTPRMAVEVAVRHLAQAYAHHPDHRPGWRP
ncbi:MULTISPECIES: DUF6221 family protein [unclassified Streptomyces]|uniref:DUF6221 family protein n=1 Tax=unclassified Streptomyces TaxID=2593676 RepID=UPI002E0E6F17|nr:MULTISPECIES: DUF6221 family protein [unclassified Streptomyces]WSQ83075.1 DUF6221 family protein [Streptomyces sp. NBC_01212]WSR10897.1 DUF6221 family protein [Streptomyces sp. NBC_01208]WSR46409.1 DUF6221 family protein [Streptomyces sp. NBC_01201]